MGWKSWSKWKKGLAIAGGVVVLLIAIGAANAPKSNSFAVVGNEPIHVTSDHGQKGFAVRAKFGSATEIKNDSFGMGFAGRSFYPSDVVYSTVIVGSSTPYGMVYSEKRDSEANSPFTAQPGFTYLFLIEVNGLPANTPEPTSLVFNGARVADLPTASHWDLKSSLKDWKE